MREKLKMHILFACSIAMVALHHVHQTVGHPCEEEETPDDIVVTFYPPKNAFILMEGTIGTINVTVAGVKGNLSIVSIESESPEFFEPILTESDIDIPIINGSASFNLQVKGVFVGVANLLIKFEHHYESDKQEGQFLVHFHEYKYLVRAGLKPTLIKTIFTYSLTVWLVISYVTMGTKMDLDIIWSKFKRPYGVTIGILCQFGIMPILAFGLANLFPIPAEAAIGLLIEGSCPGGWLSNVFALMMDVDFILSITMTFCSSLMALVMMPFNMFLYAGPFIGERGELKTPYKDISIQLMLMMIPVVIGMMILRKKPKLAEKMSSGLKPISMGLIVITLAFGIPSLSYIFVAPIEVYVVAGLLPFFGGALGFSISKICRRPYPEAFTIAFETGVQNSLLASVVSNFSYPYPENLLISRLPFLTAILTIIEGTAMIGIYVIYSCIYRKGREPMPEGKYEQCETEEGPNKPEKDDDKDANENGKYANLSDEGEDARDKDETTVKGQSDLSHPKTTVTAKTGKDLNDDGRKTDV